MKSAPIPGETLVEELDMFATTTDIQGRVVPLRLADMLVWERKYRQDFHFRYAAPRGSGAGANDFKDENNPFLAFVARCTSSFPFAFEPMQLSKLSELKTTKAWPNGVRLPDLETWERFFDNTDQLYTGSNLNRAFGDGGYLNNAPFSYVVQMLGRHDSPYPTERQLMYVEPSPAHPEDEAAGDADLSYQKKNAPNALENAYDAMIKLPDAQPIHDDLQRVIERNRLVRKVVDLSNMVTANIYQRHADAPECPQLNLDAVGDISYLVARVYATTDELAKVMSQWFEFPDRSSFYYGVRCIVKAWRERKYEAKPLNVGDEAPTEGKVDQDSPMKRASALRGLVGKYIEFLRDYDADYAKRRYRFVRQQINLFYSCDGPALLRLKTGFGIEITFESQERKDFQRALIDAKKPFDDAHRMIGDALRRIRPADRAAQRDKTAVKPSSEPKPTHPQPTAAKSVIDFVLGTPPWNANGAKVNSGSSIADPPRSPLEERFVGLQERVETFKNNNESAALESRGVEQAERAETYQGVMKQQMTASLSAQDDEDYMKRARQVIPYLEREVEGFANEISEILKRAMGLALESVQIRLDVWKGGTDGIWSTQGGKYAYEIVRFFHDCFEQFDTGIFPLTYDTDVSVPELVSVVRISPDDATGIFDIPPRTQKLAGATLAHFGAFLDRSFRTNDILWGRLDGAERIIHSMMANAQTANLAQRVEVEKRLIAEAQTIILEDFLDERKEEFSSVLLEVGKSMGSRLTNQKDQVDAAIANIKATLNALPPQPFKEAVLGFLSTDQMRTYLQTVPVKREPDRQTTLESVTRGVRILGGMLEGSSDQTKGAGKWVTRLGSVLWVIVEAAVPDSLAGHFFVHVVALLFWVEAVIFVGGAFFNQPLEMVGLKLLVITGLIWMVQNSVMNYLLSGIHGARKRLFASVLIALASIAIIFAIVFWVGPWTSSWLHQHWHFFPVVPCPAV